MEGVSRTVQRMPMTSSDDLLDCPFCGGPGVLRVNTAVKGLTARTSTGYRIECEGNCHAMTSYWQTVEESTEAWNRRT